MAPFKERLLQIMDKKHHWGWEHIRGPHLSRTQLLTHFQQEYEVYVRDFPILLSRVLGRMDKSALLLKREFAENIYEEQTGGLSKEISSGLSHPELFERMMMGLGFKPAQFANVKLFPKSLAYRSFLDLVTFNYDWRVAAAILTLFVEGSIEDRARNKIGYRPTQSLEVKLRSHSLHKFYGLKLKDMTLVRAHHMIEGDHRRSAWETVLRAIPPSLHELTLKTMENALDLWLLYRDGVLEEMGFQRPSPLKRILKTKKTGAALRSR